MIEGLFALPCRRVPDNCEAQAAVCQAVPDASAVSGTNTYRTPASLVSSYTLCVLHFLCAHAGKAFIAKAHGDGCLIHYCAGGEHDGGGCHREHHRI